MTRGRLSLSSRASFLVIPSGVEGSALLVRGVFEGVDGDGAFARSSDAELVLQARMSAAGLPDVAAAPVYRITRPGTLCLRIVRLAELEHDLIVYPQFPVQYRCSSPYRRPSTH